MDIHSQAEYPASALSNSAPHEFCLDGFKCASMEGFLQSLKTLNHGAQVMLCLYFGEQAKEKGAEYHDLFLQTQSVWWQGRFFSRHSQEYQELLDRAFDELAKNENFVEALLETGTEELTHSIGKQDPHETILTEDEFCSRLMRIRTRLQGE